MNHRQEILQQLRSERDTIASDLAAIDKAIAALHTAGDEIPTKPNGRNLSAAGRKAISEGAKKRWAKYRRAKKGKRG